MEIKETKTSPTIQRFREKFPDPMTKKYGKGFKLYCSNCSGENLLRIEHFILQEIGTAREEGYHTRDKELLDENYVERSEGKLLQETAKAGEDMCNIRVKRLVKKVEKQFRNSPDCISYYIFKKDWEKLKKNLLTNRE